MKICTQCQHGNPPDANYCMHCGYRLEDNAPDQDPLKQAAGTENGWSVFWLTLDGSLVLSWLLIAVLHLPVLIIGAFLPLLWFSRK